MAESGVAHGSEIFEVHVTGDESIHAAAAKLGVKTIAVHLLDPDKGVMRTEHMTSQVWRHDSFHDCVREVMGLCVFLEHHHVPVRRVKIESPFYEHYARQSLYMESHFVSGSFDFPTSRNAKKDTLLATDRTYDRADYDRFRKARSGAEVELCLLDSDVNEDADWFDAYKDHMSDTVLLETLARLGGEE